MEIKRRIERNNIRDKIRQIQKYIENDEDTIDRFRHQSSKLEYNSIQIAKLTAKNKERKIELETLEQRSTDLERGLLDQEIIESYKKSSKEVNRKSMETKQKKMQELADKQEKNEQSRAYYQSDRNSDRKARSDIREMDRSYKYFLRVCESVPDYMLKKLKNMPNNKGYSWRNVYCYGLLPAENGEPTLIFEKKDDTLIIHETTATEYNIWHKNGNKGRKTLYYSQKRKIKKMNTCSLLDYVR